MKRFRNLSAAQQSAFEQIASGMDMDGEISPRTLKALADRGLVHCRIVFGVGGLWTRFRYTVPGGILDEWNAWCADNFDECPQCAGNGCTGCDYSGMVEKPATVAEPSTAK